MTRSQSLREQSRCCGVYLWVFVLVYEIVYMPLGFSGCPLRRPSQPLYWRLGLRYRVRRGLHVRKGTEGFLIYLLVLVESVMCWTSIRLRNRHVFWASWASTCLSSVSPCWARPGVPRVGTPEVMPTSVAPECLVESKTRARTQKPFDSS